MDWDKLRIFHAAAEAGSFTHASERLQISQSAISRQVSALEDDLGIILFHRHARGLLLTEQGEQLFRVAQDTSLRLDAVKARLTDSKEIPTGPLRVTTTIALGSTWLSGRLNEFVNLYPEIQLNLILDDTELDFAKREADVAIRLRQPKQADIIQRKLFIVHFHLYASSAYLDQFGTPQSVEDLDSHRVITYGQSAPGYLSSTNWLETAGIPSGKPARQPAVRINNIFAIKRAVQNGIGIAMLPDYLIERGSGLVRIMPHATMPTVESYLAYPSELKTSARVRVFCDFLVSKAQQWAF